MNLFCIGMKFAEKVEKAWKDWDTGKFKTKSKDAFLKELRRA